MDKAVKLAIVVGVLLAGFGVFYHYVVYLPGVDQRKAEQEEQRREEAARRERIDKERAELQQSARQIAYENCKSGARLNYEANWATACKTVARANAENLKNCS